ADLLGRDLAGNVRELQNIAERTARQNLEPGTFQPPDQLSSARSPTAPEPSAPPSPSSRPPDTAPSAEDAAPSDAAGANAEHLRAAGDALGLAHKTILKLIPGDALAAACGAAGSE